MRHKLDDRVYALKKVPLHTKFDPNCQEQILLHPAMKEIQAISRLAHKNIVGYKGSWVEADEPCIERLKRVCAKLERRQVVIDEINEYGTRDDVN